jgi:2-oxo-3-hexenedioate decarboxylase
LASLDPKALADELTAAYAAGGTIATLFSERDPRLDLDTAYLVEAELASRRRARGRTTVGRKVGFANKALWRVLKLNTLVWAHMYDDTVGYASGNAASYSLAHLRSPKIEPEIVFKMKQSPGSPGLDPLEPAALLDAVEWLALGFEIIDCPFADWRVQPADFVAAFGLHAALIVGEPRPIVTATIPTLVDQLARFKVRLLKDGQLVEEGSGRNSLRSPALCLGELASAIARRADAEPLASGELISSGTLTDSHSIASGETWAAVVDGLELPDLSLRTTA